MLCCIRIGYFFKEYRVYGSKVAGKDAGIGDWVMRELLYMMVELFIMVRIAKQFVYSLMCLLIKERKLKGSSMIRIKGGLVF